MESPIGPKLIAELLDRHGRALEFYARQWTSAGEDCAQEAFIELARQEVVREEPGAGTPRLAYEPLKRPFFVGRGSVDPFMLSMRNDDLYREPFDDFEPSTPSKTSRELLQEMLPELNRRTELEDTPKRFWFRTLRRAFS